MYKGKAKHPLQRLEKRKIQPPPFPTNFDDINDNSKFPGEVYDESVFDWSTDSISFK